MSVIDTPNPEILELECKLAAVRAKAEADRVAAEERKRKVEEVEQRRKAEEAEAQRVAEERVRLVEEQQRASEAANAARAKAAGKVQAKAGPSEVMYTRAEIACVQCTRKGLECFRPSTGLKKVCRKCASEKTQCDWPGKPVKKRRMNTGTKAGKKTAEEVHDSDVYDEPEMGPSKKRKWATKQGEELAEAVLAPLLGTGARWSTRLEEEMSDHKLILCLLTEVQQLRVNLLKEQVSWKMLELKLERVIHSTKAQHEVRDVVIKDYMEKVAEELRETETEWEGSESESESELEELEELE
ncbi:hypothetical protein FOMPIDRAFT_1052570 [Fomitopsis schrenkii]|uniref:Uncharacterized protein n=1 Tax=Fomitopsis schrenkii TaxID=2126942 RepID=S8DW36_FOMSC|nr:hypothetical protein FOMPIDRAFT_1052570 [Fomitopsis schrenkii]